MTQEMFSEKLSLEMDQGKLSSKECKELGLKNKNENHRVCEFDGYNYALTLSNNSDMDFPNVTVECRFYYEVTESWRTMKSRSVVTQKYFNQSIKIPKLLARSEHSAEVGPFVLESNSIPSGFYYNDGSAEAIEAKPKGLWVKVFWTAPDGKKLTADFSDPESLSAKTAW